MSFQPERSEISEYTIRLIIGVIAIFLASVTSTLSEPSVIQSISAAYFEGDWPRNVFVGSLFAISAFLLAYNGNLESCFEFWLSKLAAISAIFVATFPCQCDEYDGKMCVHINESFISIHGVFAGVLFVILAIFCYRFFKRARSKIKLYDRAKWRSYIYAVCGCVMIISMAVIFLDHIKVIQGVDRIVFYGEAASLAAFGVAWLTASRILPVITNKGDDRNRFSPFVPHVTHK